MARPRILKGWKAIRQWLFDNRDVSISNRTLKYWDARIGIPRLRRTNYIMVLEKDLRHWIDERTSIGFPCQENNK